MSNEVYEVKTNLNPDQLTALAIDTYMAWLNFALGKSSLGGKVLQHPSGRYAAALSWKKTGVASVAIIADESVPEVGWIEYGRAGADMREAMLGGGNTKVGKDGYRYRVVPIRPDSKTPSFSAADLQSGSDGGGLTPGTAKLWAKPRSYVADGSKLVTMSENPNAHAKGVDAWKVPAMPAYSAGQILADLAGRAATMIST